MYTTDEWGNTVFHIQTGRSGLELLKNSGINNMPREDYEKHIQSYRKLQEKKNNELQEFIDDFLKWCKT